MSILHGTWADLGYRKLDSDSLIGGTLTKRELAERISQLGDYEVLSDNWVRRHARRKNTRFPESIQIASVLDRKSVLEEERLAFIEQHAASKWVQFEETGVRFRAELNALVRGVEKAKSSEHRWRGMYRLAQALIYVDPAQLRMMSTRHVAPAFFELYPEGRIVAIRYDTDIDETAAIARSIYAMTQVPGTDLMQGGFKGVRTLQNWHMVSLPQLLPRLLHILNYLFYPFVGAARGGSVAGLEFVFLFDHPERHKLFPFPRNWLAMASGSAGFGKEDIDAVKMITDFGGPVHERGSHQRFTHAQGFSSAERLELLRWYIPRLNRWLYELVDMANFTKDHNPQEVIDPVFGYEHQLTVDRLLRKTLLAMTLDEASAGNLTVFEIADLYETLSQRFKNQKSDGAFFGQAGFFKALFDTQQGPALVLPRLSPLPTPFDLYLSDLTKQCYSRIEQTVRDSVWLASKAKKDGILVRNEDLASEVLMPVPQFVAEVMRAYRNAHHGYFSADPTSRNRPSRFLFLVDGNLPVEMSVLPALWWLAYISDPSFVGWKHLEIGAYD